MPDARNGFITATVGVLNGIILYYLLKGFVDAGLLSASWLAVYELVNILAILVFVHAHLTGELVTSLGGGLVSVSCGIQG